MLYIASIFNFIIFSARNARVKAPKNSLLAGAAAGARARVYPGLATYFFYSLWSFYSLSAPLYRIICFSAFVSLKFVELLIANVFLTGEIWFVVESVDSRFCGNSGWLLRQNLHFWVNCGSLVHSNEFGWSLN